MRQIPLGVLLLTLLSLLPLLLPAAADRCLAARASISGYCSIIGTVAGIGGAAACASTAGIGCAIALAAQVLGPVCDNVNTKLNTCSKPSEIEELREKMKDLQEDTEKILGFMKDIKEEFVEQYAIKEDIFEVLKKMDSKLLFNFFEAKYIPAIQDILIAEEVYQHEVLTKQTHNGLLTHNRYTDDWKDAVLFGRYDIRGALYTLEDMIEGQDYLTKTPSLYELAHTQGFCSSDLFNYMLTLLTFGRTHLEVARRMDGEEAREEDTTQFKELFILNEDMFIRHCSCNATACWQVERLPSGRSHDVLFKKGSSLTSPNGEARFTMREDGNLVVTCPKSGSPNNPIWQSGTAGQNVEEGLILLSYGPIYLPCRTKCPWDIQKYYSSMEMGLWERPGGVFRTGDQGVTLSIRDNHDVELRDTETGVLHWNSQTAWKCPYDEDTTDWSNSVEEGPTITTKCTPGQFITAFQFNEQVFGYRDYWNNYYTRHQIVNAKITCSDGDVKYATPWFFAWNRKIPSTSCEQGIAEMAGKNVPDFYHSRNGQVKNLWVRCKGSFKHWYSNDNDMVPGWRSWGVNYFRYFRVDEWEEDNWNAALRCREGTEVVGIQVRYFLEDADPEHVSPNNKIVNWRLKCARVK